MSLIKNTRRPIEKIITATMLLAFCFGLSSIISATPVSATNTFSINIDNSIALRVLDKTGETAITTFALPLAATPRGAFTSDYFNVEVSSDNAFGYRLFMSTDYQAGSPAAYTTDLVNTDDSSVSVSTLASKDVAKSDFSRPSGSYVNSWGYSLDNTIFNPVPDHTTSQVIKFQKQEINRDLVPVYIGANVDSSKISGVYRNVLTFSAIGNLPATGYTLYFDAGTTDPVDNLPATMTAEEQSATHTFTIPSTAPTREGYAFTGYRDIETGTLYQAGDTITVAGNEQFVGSAELSAEWEAAHYIQDQTYIDECKAADTGTKFELTDSRDNNVYTVAKLADGKCWMTQNLRLTGSRTLTANDSDVSSNWTLPAETASDFDWGETCVDTAYNMKSTTAATYASYGNYYNWYAATAGTGTCAMESGNATSSICPRGWRLPTGGSSGEFQTLYGYYNSPSAMLSSPVNFVLSGIRYSSSTDSLGSIGYYWSGTAVSSYSANDLDISSSFVSPAYGFDKYFGLAIRCVAR